MKIKNLKNAWHTTCSKMVWLSLMKVYDTFTWELFCSSGVVVSSSIQNSLLSWKITLPCQRKKKIQILGTKPFVKITTQSIPSSRLEPVEEITLKPNIFYQSWFMLLFLAIDKLSRELHVDRVTYWQIVANNQRLVVILCTTVVHSLAIFRKAYKSSRCSTG